MASSMSGQDESNPVLWLATRAGKMELSYPLGTTRCVPQEKCPRKPYNKSFIDRVCSVKMAGYWPHSFFAWFWTSTPSRSINTQKKNFANIQPSWPNTWSITHTSWFPFFFLDGSGRDFKISRRLAQVTGYFKHLRWVLFVAKFVSTQFCFANVVMIWSFWENK